MSAIREELAERLAELEGAGKLLEAQRLESRTHFDIEMLLEVGTCAGIENYSRPPQRPARRASAPRASSTTSRPTSWWWWTSRT